MSNDRLLLLQPNRTPHMNEGGILLRNILTDPADNTARLVFADWLEEHGEGERAEFIRDSIVRFRTGSLWPDNADNRSAIILKSLPAGVGGVIGRGFFWRIELPCAGFMRHAEALFRQHPVTEVRLSDKWPLLASYTTTTHSPGASPGASHTVWGFHPTSHWRDYQNGIPWELWSVRSLATGEGAVETPHGTAITFADSESANKWLSGLCVTYGRIQAGLSVPFPSE